MQMLLRLGLASEVMVLLCVLVQPAQARVVSDLYEVVETVPSRGTSDRIEASGRGLERVFVRVTGDADIGGNPLLLPVLQRAQQYVQGYRYETDGNQLYLHLSYEPQAISEQVQKLQLPMWPNNRPGTLVWIAVDTLQGGRSALSQQDQPELYAALDSVAIGRGLPVEFPVMDLNDHRNMPVGSLWAQDERAAERAGVRYHPDATLMGRLLQTSGQRWQANWLLIHGGRSYAFDASGDSMEEVAMRGIDEAANLLAQRYAVRQSGSAEQSAVIVELSGIDSFADYSEANSYLRGLVQVSRVELLSIESDRMRLALSTSSPVQNLQDALALNHKLSAQADEDLIDLSGYRALPGSVQHPLRYLWR